MAELSRRQLLQAGAVASVANAGGDVLRVRTFDAAGKAAPPGLLGSLLATDANGRPFELLPQSGSDGTATLALPAEKFELTMVLPVRGFGQVYLYADNGAALYSAKQTTGGELLLNYEFARSRAAHANDSLAETMWAGEMAALERARWRIARRGPRPGFLFGCNAFEFDKSEEYARRFTALLNYATLPFYRAFTEKKEGSPDYSRVDAVLAKLVGSRILTKGHPLVWFHRAGVPEFLKKKSWEEVKRSSRDYVLRSVGRYRPRIHAWDVINEAHDWANDLGLSAEQLLEMTRLASEATREADPTAFRVVNSCCTWGEYVARRRSYSGPLGRRANTPLEYMKAVEDARVPYEAIGLQVYYPARDTLEIERHLERFFVLGKPVHITELGVSSANEPVPSGEVRTPNRNVWHGTEWNEQIQADWVEQFYTICYSKPEIEAITWWDFSDPAFIPHAGFLHADFRPKASYERLVKLLAGWRG